MHFNAEAQRRRELFLRREAIDLRRDRSKTQDVGHVSRLTSHVLGVLIFLCAESVAWADGTPLSRVGGEAVTVADAARAAAKGGYAIRDEASAERALGEAEDFELLVAGARREGCFEEPDIVQTIRALAVQRLLARKAGAEGALTEPDEATARVWYEANLAEFTRPAVCRGRVLIISKDAADWTSRRDGAVALLATNAPTAFAAAVKAWSTDAAARANGGRTTWLTEGVENRRYPAEVVSALFAQERDGTVVGPVETDRAVYWIQRTELRSGSVTPFEAARPGIARRMEQQSRRDAYAEFVKGLRSSAKIERANDAAKRLLEEARGEGRPPAGPGPAVK